MESFNLNFNRVCFECSIWFLVFNALITLIYLIASAYIMTTLKRTLKIKHFLVILTFCIVFIIRFGISILMFTNCHNQNEMVHTKSDAEYKYKDI